MKKMNSLDAEILGHQVDEQTGTNLGRTASMKSGGPAVERDVTRDMNISNVPLQPDLRLEAHNAFEPRK